MHTLPHSVEIYVKSLSEAVLQMVVRDLCNILEGSLV